ncbi:MAG: D-alanyl-D-alanine carboxypeptidase/D-alanyl-D-alanine endopeptidase [Armatimonadota bacterium]
MQSRSPRRYPAYITILVLICYSILFVLSASPADTGTSLVQVLNACISDPALAHGTQGILVESLKDGRRIYEKNSSLTLLPASNLKLVVSAAALDRLGPDFRYRTSLFTKGPQTPDGTLRGDIILVGAGDPVFKYEHLQEMAAKIRQMGIKSVEGNIVADDSLFDDVRLGLGWAWDYESYDYAAQISALNLNGNAVKVWVYPGAKAGSPSIVKITPATGYVVVKNECKTSSAKSAKTVSVERVRGRNTIRVTGTVPADYKPSKEEESITVEDPALYACQTLMEILRRSGITVKGQTVRGKKTSDAVLAASHDSVPLSDILALLNKPSDNLIAECLLKTLGAKFKGSGSSSAGREIELEFLKQIGADMTAVSMIDGSGLSRMNYISPVNIAAVLRYMYNHKYSKVFIDSLPIAGIDGTLKRRLKSTPAEGIVKAKTGYLSCVSAVSGYVLPPNGEPLLFTIQMNNHLCTNKEATAIQDKMIEALVTSGIR